MGEHMKNDVLVALADRNFLDQAKQLFATAYWNSGWSGDYLLLAHDIPEPSLSWFREKGIHVLHCAPLDCGSSKKGDIITASKCYLFSEFLKQWQSVVYLDVDIVTRGSLNGLAGSPGFAACSSLGQTVRENLIAEHEIPATLRHELSHRFDLDRQAFNSGVMAFPSSIIHGTMLEDLLAVFVKFGSCARFGGDQLPLNLYFYDKWRQLPGAYNQIISVDYRSYDPAKLSGLVIHCVSFGNGPWTEGSIFFGEWQANFKRADAIDLRNIPAIGALPDEEIKRRSVSALRECLSRGDPGIAANLRLLGRVIRHLVTNPKASLAKARSVLLRA